MRCLVKRIGRYVRWRIGKARTHPRFYQHLLVPICCILLFIVSSLYVPKGRWYDDEPYDHYPITLTCQLERIIDGDTVVMQCPKPHDPRETSRRSVRIWGIDAPETGQKPWGEMATQTLKNMIGDHRAIELQVMEKDQYGRLLAKLFIQAQDVGLEMVEAGAAIVYARYNHDQDYINAQKRAKMSRLGIWQTAGAQQQPEQWRRLHP